MDSHRVAPDCDTAGAFLLPPSNSSATKQEVTQEGDVLRKAAARRRKEDGPDVVELGRGGLRFVRRGAFTLAERCDGIGDNGTTTAIGISYAILSAELPKVYALVKSKGGSVTASELRKQFRSSPLSDVADSRDWEGWTNDFSPKNRDRGRPKGAALTFLERKLSLERNTIKTYLSKANNPSKK
jgi:hypothetical protein